MILITEALETRILQILEVTRTQETSDLLLAELIDEVENDLAEAERIEGDIYVY